MPPAAWQGPDIKNPKPETVRLISFTARGNYRTDVALADQSIGNILKRHDIPKAPQRKTKTTWAKFIQSHRAVLAATDFFSVYPHEVVIEALNRNAAAVILCHNHPSGSPQPSQADLTLTSTLKAALALVDVRVLDHLIVTRMEAVSLAERGMM